MNLSSMQTMIVRFTEKFFMNRSNNFVGGIFAEIGVLLSKIWEEEWMFTGYTQGNQSYEIVIQKHKRGCG